MTASIIIVYNDKESIEAVKANIANQVDNRNIEIIFLDNTNGKFQSAAEALNYGASIANADVLIFMHQDVLLLSDDIVFSYCSFLNQNPKAIIGAAGVLPNDKRTITDIYDSLEKLPIGVRANGKVYEVDSLDECFFAMKKNTWSTIKFDERCCDNWHSYGIDICFANRLNGGKVYMVPAELWHRSSGNSYSKSYYSSIKKLVLKYSRTSIKYINGTCVYLKCNKYAYYRYRVLIAIKHMLFPLINAKHHYIARKNIK